MQTVVYSFFFTVFHGLPKSKWSFNSGENVMLNSKYYATRLVTALTNLDELNAQYDAAVANHNISLRDQLNREIGLRHREIEKLIRILHTRHITGFNHGMPGYTGRR